MRQSLNKVFRNGVLKYLLPLSKLPINKSDLKSNSSVLKPRSGKFYFRGSDYGKYLTKKQRTKVIKDCKRNEFQDIAIGNPKIKRKRDMTKQERWDSRRTSSGMTFLELDQWSKFIEDQEWQFFATFTTRATLTLKSARQAIDAWNEELSSFLNIDHSRDHGSYRVFFVIEPHNQYGKGGYHIHALINLPKYWQSREMEKLAFTAMLNIWQDVTKGSRTNWNRIQIETYRGVKAARYTLKYLTKILVDWDYFCIFNTLKEEPNEGLFKS